VKLFDLFQRLSSSGLGLFVKRARSTTPYSPPMRRAHNGTTKRRDIGGDFAVQDGRLLAYIERSGSLDRNCFVSSARGPSQIIPTVIVVIPAPLGLRGEKTYRARSVTTTRYR
jgi:hypothetical protein